MAIEQALIILSWYENRPSDEIPPRHLWEDSEGLEAWWEGVDAKRDDDGIPTVSGRRDLDDDVDDDDAPRVMVQNDIATFLKKRG